MTTKTIVKNLQQKKSRFSLIVEQILLFNSSSNLVKDAKLYNVVDTFHSDK